MFLNRSNSSTPVKPCLISIAVFSLALFPPFRALAEDPQALYDREAPKGEQLLVEELFELEKESAETPAEGEFVVEVLQLAEKEPSAEEGLPAEQELFEDEELEELDEELAGIADPIEPVNRAMFHVNDKLYFWVLKPVARGYGFVVPEKGRIAVRRFLSNLTTPVRFVNAVLQFKFDAAGKELSRFAINTTVGVLGFGDPARNRWNLRKHEEDFGQTLGVYGSGPGFYITWPLLGPSSLRDTFGLVGDFLVNPMSYIFPNNPELSVGLYAYSRVNETSLTIGDYEEVKKELEPYIFLRNAYHQHRESAIKE
jgi:phospholipid-binding lipoprotein MlaA